MQNLFTQISCSSLGHHYNLHGYESMHTKVALYALKLCEDRCNVDLEPEDHVTPIKWSSEKWNKSLCCYRGVDSGKPGLMGRTFSCGTDKREF